jgi:hypothetical protein
MKLTRALLCGLLELAIVLAWRIFAKPKLEADGEAYDWGEYPLLIGSLAVLTFLFSYDGVAKPVVSATLSTMAFQLAYMGNPSAVARFALYAVSLCLLLYGVFSAVELTRRRLRSLGRP